ncbi:MAG TPA: putrescine-ornithine antiporter [Gemmatimonadales bacterium]|nr:putrescine-ornithine antiporter [Gemmatimonadales bacterium]
MADTKKKMNLIQLTFIVAVNMMGSGIIMLPTNMAQVGAISLLSWGVTAVGSMAIAYGFAQAGIFNQRPGGMAAYAEDAYGKGGYFLTFLLYFFSLAIGNVAIAISAVGYLAGFFPGMSATPIATCISVIALIWLTTAANFGGPSITGKIGQVTVWGVIIPVAGLSVIGWFWFKGDVFMQAWNPKGMKLLEGMGSSIALTLWAFLGMESAAQNSDAVENPKRDVPLACLFGTLGAAVVYILSTTVIQGIVPNAELAKSTGPFALAYAKMFNPTIGSIIMGLAVLACLGSLLGWQFTIGRTAKTAADDRLFPSIFSRENAMGAPVAGMVVMGIVQTVMALSTISPSLSEQFSALVNLAVVTNVIPYIISLSALAVMMKGAGVADGVFKRNMFIATVATVYSTYAIYASGKDAVLGGTIVLALTYILYGFLAPRFTASAEATLRPSSGRGAAVAAAVALAAAFALASLFPGGAHAAPKKASKPAAAKPAATKAAKLVLGYYANGRPFSYDDGGKPAGYAVELCESIAEQMKARQAGLEVSWVQVTPQNRAAMLREGKVNVVCGEPDRLSARAEMAFSIPIFQSGVGALLRSDAPLALAKALSERPGPSGPLWRGTPTEQLLQSQTLAVISGSAAETALAEGLAKRQLTAKVVPVKDFSEGVQAVLERKANVFFTDRSMLLDAQKRDARGGELVVMPRRFTIAPIALAVKRGDEEARLALDRALSRIYAAPEFRATYAKWFGAPDAEALAFFRAVALPE